MTERMASNEDIPEITPSRDSDNEIFIRGIFERNTEAISEKEKYVNFLESKSFDSQVLSKSIERWNQNMLTQKGFNGQYSEIEEIQTPNGKLKIIYYRESDSIKFAYIPGKLE